MSNRPTLQFEESGFTFETELESVFRFKQSNIFKRLSREGIKDIDVGWLSDGYLYLLELLSRGSYKRYIKRNGLGRVSPNIKIDYFIDYLIEKATDSLLALSAMWLNTNKGNELSNDYPREVVSFDDVTSIRIYFLYRADDNLMVELNNHLKRRFGSKIVLYDSNEYGIITIKDTSSLLPGVAIGRTQR